MPWSPVVHVLGHQLGCDTRHTTGALRVLDTGAPTWFNCFMNTPNYLIRKHSSQSNTWISTIYGYQTPIRDRGLIQLTGRTAKSVREQLESMIAKGMLYAGTITVQK